MNKALFGKVLKNLRTTHSNSAADKIVRMKVKSGHYPPIVLVWLREKYDQESKKYHFHKNRPNADLPYRSSDRTPSQRLIALQRARRNVSAYKRRNYIKKMYSSPDSTAN